MCYWRLGPPLKPHVEIACAWSQRVVHAAKKTERKFLNISDTWTSAEKRIFKRGVTLYRGALCMRVNTTMCCLLFFLLRHWLPTYCWLCRARADRVLQMREFDVSAPRRKICSRAQTNRGQPVCRGGVNSERRYCVAT